MSRGKIKIEDIVVKRQNDSCVLSAKINDNGTTKELYYGVNERYEGYLVTERSDAFVVALLYYAMFNEYDIEWVVPCDQQLVYQLETYFIPVYSKEFPFMHDIILSGPVTCEKLPSAGAVATGISNGVDSCYTMHKYLEPKFSSMKLSHLIFTNWFITDYSSENQADFMEKYLSKLPNQAESLGLEFVFVDFRVDTLFSIGHINDPIRGVIQDEGLFTLKYCSIALALQSY